MVSKEQIQISKKWFKKGKCEDDSFDRFICLWIAFNALYGAEAEDKEYKQIESFVLKNSDQRYKSVLGNGVFFHNVIKNLHQKGRAPADTKPYVEKLKCGDTPLEEKLKNLFFCIYMAMCNLFHGEKTPGNYKDEEIAEYAATVLEHYLTIYFENCKSKC